MRIHGTIAARPAEAACARALELDVVNVTKIASMLVRATENAAPPPRLAAAAVNLGESLCGVVAVTSAVSDLPVVAGL